MTSKQPFAKVDQRESEMMISDHVCSSANSVNALFDICSTCGVFIPQDYHATFGKSHMVRSLAFRVASSNRFITESALLELVTFEPTFPVFDAQFQAFGQRNRIITNLKLISTHYGYSLTTYYLSIYYVDVVLSHSQVSDEYTHLFTYCCCLIAAKVTEPQIDIPLIESIVEFFQNTFSAQMIRNMENFILQSLSYKMITHTAYSISATFLSFGIVNSEEIPLDILDKNAFLASVERTVLEFIDTISDNYAFNQFSPSLQAFAAIACARKVHKLGFWSPDLATLTQTQFSQLHNAIETFIEVVNQIDATKADYFSDFFCKMDNYGNKCVALFDIEPRVSWQNTAPSKSSGQYEDPFADNDRENIDNNNGLSVLDSLEKRFSTQPAKSKGHFVRSFNRSFSSIANTIAQNNGNSKGKQTATSNSENQKFSLKRGNSQWFSSDNMRI